MGTAAATTTLKRRPWWLQNISLDGPGLALHRTTSTYVYASQVCHKLKDGYVYVGASLVTTAPICPCNVSTITVYEQCSFDYSSC